MKVNCLLLPLPDINECQEGRDLCDKSIEECVNTKGDYWCTPLLNPLTTIPTTSASTTTLPVNFTIPPPPPLPPRPELPTPECPSGYSFDTKSKKCTGKIRHSNNNFMVSIVPCSVSLLYRYCTVMK